MANEEYITTSKAMKEAQEREWEYRHREDKKTIENYERWTSYAKEGRKENGCS